MAKKNKANNSQTNTPTNIKTPDMEFALSQLDYLGEVLGQGYSDNTWTTAGRVLKSLEGFLHQADRETLAEVWRDTYTQEITPEQIAEKINLVKSNIRY